ncbi:P-loop containing nucleoside triphosphate hydrolase protein [Artomyces pyxidatus]|uniref:P-loop containing nucleoside triphosphate hydrolase protein n=1 Tax=Artomyces pyxidatus TaxID=48021 RepID=A0ACB8T0K0_9AGAM|nr:P-loop containing nucleoside triphosphate hydrolase protein [Artomyces pyxidatus]
MAKRRVTVEDDVEDRSEGSSSGAKRARFDRHDPEVINYQPEPVDEPQPTRSRARRRAVDDEDVMNIIGEDEADVVDFRDQHADDETAEARFEEEHEEEIRESIRQRNKLQGGVAKFGIIEAVEMHQFMCHKYLTFKFGPQINFIIGHNGSGKSAVLSAITVALGGKATSTGRGNGLKAFIREGQSASEVSIQLKNQGEEAYKHDIYGDSIIITRTFTNQGSSSYKIKSRDGKLISTKREELSAICDHMNIQVDNPMNVLTQDAARQFLSASHPSDKYKFFLRGTQLSQLSEEYETCLENISQTTKVLMRKREAIPDLQAQFKEASARFQEASKAREQRHKADELKKELAWAHVGTKEDELRDRMKEREKLERRLPKIQQSLTSAEAKFQAATLDVERLEQEHETLGNVEHLRGRKRELQELIRTNKNKIMDLKNEERTMSDSILAVKRQIESLESRIHAEQAKSAAHSQTQVDELNARFEQTKDELRSAEEQLRELERESETKRSEAQAVRTQAEDAERELRTAQKDVSDANEQITRCKEQQNNSLAPYGRNMNAVLEQIGRMRWHGQKPVGPFGTFVKVKDPKTWAPLLRSVLGGFMTSFAVTDARDMPVLKKLFRESGNPGINIFVSEVDLFDYREGELDQRYFTVLRAIEVSDEYVLRILINQANIERTLLARTRKEADEQLKEIRGGGVGVAADMYRVRRYPDGGGQSSPIQVVRSGDPRNLLFTNEDADSQLRRWQEHAQQADAKCREINKRTLESRQQFTELQKAAEACKAQAGRLHRSIMTLKRTRDQIQTEINDSVLVETSGLDEALQEMVRERESIRAQFEAVEQQKLKYDEAQKPLVEEMNTIKEQENEFEGRRQAAAARIEQAVERRLEAQNEQGHYARKLAEEQKKVDDAKAVEDAVQKEFELWTAKAEEYCARVENPRKAEEVQRNLDSVQKALKDREKRHGATVEEMTLEVNKAQLALDTAQKDLKIMVALNKALKASLRIRLQKWHDFRRHIAFRCKVVFQYHLSNRGYFGKVLFNHQDGTLQLKVQTDDLNNTQQGSRDKDPRSLSGGEKSFATICLLLAMWESIGSPIRCLDEFDVFMDAVNRRISMKMMIDTANSSDGKQYVLITPQNMQNIHVGTTVRVHRMSDPERGQGTLAYGSSVA